MVESLLKKPLPKKTIKEPSQRTSSWMNDLRVMDSVFSKTEGNDKLTEAEVELSIWLDEMTSIIGAANTMKFVESHLSTHLF
jgi:hypothetical protein